MRRANNESVDNAAMQRYADSCNVGGEQGGGGVASAVMN